MSQTSLIWTIFLIITFLVIAWHVRALFQLGKIEKQIFEKESRVDAIPAEVVGRTSGSLVTQKQLEAQINNKQQPIRREIELLEKRRKFIIEKAPLIGIFKR